MAKPGTQIDVRFYRLRNKLQEKAGGLGGAGGAEGGSFSPELMEKAEAHLQQMSEEYPDWVSTYVVQLMDEHAAGWAKPMAERAVNMLRISRLAHDLKGQGGTFGYPLISHFGESLYNFTVPGSGMRDNHFEIIKAHIEAMQAVIHGRVAGDGGEVGADLVKTLHAAIEKFQRHLGPHGPQTER